MLMSRKLPNINTYRRRRLYEDLRLSGKEKCERRDDPAAADKKENVPERPGRQASGGGRDAGKRQYQPDRERDKVRGGL